MCYSFWGISYPTILFNFTLIQTAELVNTRRKFHMFGLLSWSRMVQTMRVVSWFFVVYNFLFICQLVISNILSPSFLQISVSLFQGKLGTRCQNAPLSIIPILKLSDFLRNATTHEKPSTSWFYRFVRVFLVQIFRKSFQTLSCFVTNWIEWI